MSAYILVEIEVTHPDEMEEYRKLTPASIAEYQGRFLARGGKTITLEGNWNPERIVVLEFPSTIKAIEWWNSDSYSKAKAIRQHAGQTKMIIVEGYSS